MSDIHENAQVETLNALLRLAKLDNVCRVECSYVQSTGCKNSDQTDHTRCGWRRRVGGAEQVVEHLGALAVEAELGVEVEQLGLGQMRVALGLPLLALVLHPHVKCLHAIRA